MFDLLSAMSWYDCFSNKFSFGSFFILLIPATVLDARSKLKNQLSLNKSLLFFESAIEILSRFYDSHAISDSQL